MTSSLTRTGHVCTQQSNHDLSVYVNYSKYCILIGHIFPGTHVTYCLWSIAEAAISTICICLPNTLYLIRRARHHGIGALFTSREYNLSASVSRSKTAVLGANSRGRFRCIHGTTSSAVQGDCDGGTLLFTNSVSTSAQERQFSEDGEAMELGQARLGQDM